MFEAIVDIETNTGLQGMWVLGAQISVKDVNGTIDTDRQSRQLEYKIG